MLSYQTNKLCWHGISSLSQCLHPRVSGQATTAGIPARRAAYSHDTARRAATPSIESRSKFPTTYVESTVP